MTIWPTAVTDAVEADFSTVIAAVWVAGMLKVAAGDVTAGPDGGVPFAVAESLSEPLFRSAWVTVAVALKVAD